MIGRQASTGSGVTRGSKIDVAVDRDARAKLLARQARVGILVNPAKIVIPRHPPREVWSKWPKLRSARRRDGMRKAQDAVRSPPSEEDDILEGRRLAAFSNMLRSGHADLIDEDAAPERWSFPLSPMGAKGASAAADTPPLGRARVIAGSRMGQLIWPTVWRLFAVLVCGSLLVGGVLLI